MRGQGIPPKNIQNSDKSLGLVLLRGSLDAVIDLVHKPSKEGGVDRLGERISIAFSLEESFLELPKIPLLYLAAPRTFLLL